MYMDCALPELGPEETSVHGPRALGKPVEPHAGN